MSIDVRTFEYFVDLARAEVQTDIANGWVTVEGIEALLESGDYAQESTAWADALNYRSEYVYTRNHRGPYAAGVLEAAHNEGTRRALTKREGAS